MAVMEQLRRCAITRRMMLAKPIDGRTGHAENIIADRKQNAARKLAFTMPQRYMRKVIEYRMGSRHSIDEANGTIAMRKTRVALYMRVSTGGQTVENQRLALMDAAKYHDWEVVAEYVDQGISGAKGRDKRPAFDKMLKAATRHEFDLIAAWSVDRLSRSPVDLISFLNEIHAANVDLFLRQQGLDTTTSMGRAMFQLLGVFAELERATLIERVNAGLERAKIKGTKSGKPFGRPKIDYLTEKKIRAALARGDKGILKIAVEQGVGSSTVQRIKAEMAAN